MDMLSVSARHDDKMFCIVNFFVIMSSVGRTVCSLYLYSRNYWIRSIHNATQYNTIDEHALRNI